MCAMMSGLRFRSVLVVLMKRSDMIEVDVLAQLVTIHGLVTPSLVCPPCRGLVSRILLGGLTEAFIGLASSLELLDGSVAGHAGDEGS
jgi:hypothetical protein